MRFSICYQLLLPLLALMLGLVGASTWSAWSSGQHARRRIEAQIDDIARTVEAQPFALNTQILHLMKGLSGAEFMLCNAERQPIRDDEEKLIGTLSDVPIALPVPRSEATLHFDRQVRAGDVDYLCRGIRLEHSSRP